jgi:hypothetical protein
MTHLRWADYIKSNVAPDPGILCFFDPWIWDPDPGWGQNPDPDPGSRMNLPDRFSKSLETVLGLKILKFFDADTDPGWKKFGSGIRDKHPGSATLLLT